MPRNISNDACIWDMMEAAQGIMQMVEGMTCHQYQQDRRTRRAVEREIEILGEAARGISRDFQQVHPQVPWRKIIAQRHKLAHEYGETNSAGVNPIKSADRARENEGKRKSQGWLVSLLFLLNALILRPGLIVIIPMEFSFHPHVLAVFLPLRGHTFDGFTAFRASYRCGNRKNVINALEGVRYP